MFDRPQNKHSSVCSANSKGLFIGGAWNDSPTHLKCSQVLTSRDASLAGKILGRAGWSSKTRRWPSLSG